jgi:tetratricopeptide (TPR) repeat protein
MKPSVIEWVAIVSGGLLLALLYFWQSAQTLSGPAKQIAELQSAVAEGPYDEGRRYRLGHLMLQHSRPAKTIAYFSAAVATDPKPQTSHYFMGTALAQKKKFGKAFDHYRTAVEIDPAHEMTEYQWGIVLARKGRSKEALTHLKRAVEIHPEFKLAHASLAKIYSQQGDADQAQHHEKLAQASDPHTSKRYLYWGRALLKADRPEAAAVELEKALQADPEDEEAKRLLEQALGTADAEAPEDL